MAYLAPPKPYPPLFIVILQDPRAPSLNSSLWLSQVPLNEYFSLLRANGTFVQTGAPDLPPVSIGMMSFRGLQLAGSLIGPPAEIREMLEFAAKHGVHPTVQEKPMKEANQVVMDMDKGLARYRYVLVN